MIGRIHQKAFLFLLISKERQLNPLEQSFLDEHLITCDICRSQVDLHRILHQSLRSFPQRSGLSNQQLNSKLQGLLKSVERRRIVQKTSNFVLPITRLVVIALLLGFLLLILNQTLPTPTPGGLPEESSIRRAPTATLELAVPSTAPTPGTMPVGKVDKPRTEVITYTVQLGDTIYDIAAKFQLEPETILWGNYATLADNPHLLKPGMELNILPVDGVYYEWKEGDDLNEVASRSGVQPEDIIDWPGNHLKAETLGDLSHPNIKPGTMLVIPGGRREFVAWSTPFLTPYPLSPIP